MIRTLVAKATVQQTHEVGQWFFDQDYSPEQVMEWLKSKSYTIRGVRFNAAYIANYVAGARFASALVAAPKPKAKAKRAAKPKAAKAPVTTVANDDEAPF